MSRSDGNRAAGFRAAISVFFLVALVAAMGALPAAAPAQSAPPTKPVKGRCDVQSTFYDAKLTADDIDGDGIKEILVGNYNGWFYCFTPDARVKWSYYCGAKFEGGAACYDVDGDGTKEVFVGDMNGVVWGFSCNGVMLTQWGWPKQTASISGFVGVYGAPAIGDINGDGAVDVVVGCWGHYIYGWSYNGPLVFSFHNADTVWSSPALADIDRDGLKEIVIGGDSTGGSGWPYPPGGLLWVFNGDGSVLNGFPKWTPEVTWSSPACADIDNDGYYEIVVGTGHYYKATGKLTTEGHRVYAYNGDGSMCAGFPVVTAGSTFSSPAIGDVDGDGIKEIAIACNPVNGIGEDHLMLIKGNGAVMWDQRAFGGPNMASPALGDVDSDGQPEVIMGSGQAIGAWKVNGACVWNQVLDSFVITSPVVGDFDNDGRVEVAVGTGGGSGGGSLWVFDCGTKRKVTGGDAALFPWPMFHRDPMHTGSIPTGSEPPPPPPPANFHEYILMMNPGNQKANVNIEFMSEKGEKTDVKWTVEPRSRSTLHVNSVLPGVGISAKVGSDVPIIAERPMYFNYKSAWDGGHNVMGALAAQETWYFAEGTCRPNFDPYLCLQNPGSGASAVRITYMKGDGSTQVQDLTVPGNSRSTVRVKDAMGEGDSAAFDFSCRVQTTNGHAIIAERPMYFNYGGVWTGGHNVMGAPDPAPVWYFAEGTCRPGFESYLCIQNPGSSTAGIKITYMLGDGTTKGQTLSVPKNSRQTIRVKDVLGEGNTPAFDFSCKVETTNSHDVIVERPMYFNYNGWTGGHNVMGARSPEASFYFAEGTCRPNFEPYLCLQNPGGTAAAVKITYMKGDGGSHEQVLSIPARSRQTVRVKDVLGEGNTPSSDFSCKVETTNDTEIIAERPMYFNYNGWTGGHDVVGVSGPASDWFFAEGYTGL